MTPSPARKLTEARSRAAEFFAARQSRAGLLARRLLGKPDSRDASLADLLVRELRRQTRMDGSTDGSLVRTSWTLVELVQLDIPPDHAAVVRIVGWLLAQQNQAGRFGDGCTDERHSRGLCQHFLAGFFSPGTDPVAPLSFPIGVTVRDEDHARFAASCLALRAVLRARQEKRQGVIDHVSGLLTLGEVWGGWGGPWPGDVVLFALGALAYAPLEYRERAERLVPQIVRQQHEDGSWDGVDPIHAVDVLLSLPSTEGRAAVRAALPQIADLADELFAEDGNEERALAALRALQTAE